MSKFVDNKVEDVKGAGNILWIGFLAVVVIGLLSWGVWYFTVATSDVVGKGNQTIQNNSAENRTYQYNHFLTLDATIRTQAQTAQNNRDAFADFEKSHPDATKDSFSDGQTRSELASDARGAAQVCMTTVNEYNNSVKSFLAQKYADVRLPESFSVEVCKDPSKLPASMGDK